MCLGRISGHMQRQGAESMSPLSSATVTKNDYSVIAYVGMTEEPATQIDARGLPKTIKAATKANELQPQPYRLQ
jgi:hypothetical protein